MLLFLILILIWLLSTAAATTTSKSPYTYDIVLNALDTTSIDNAITFLENTKIGYNLLTEKPNVKVFLFSCNECISTMTDGTKMKLQSLHVTPMEYKSEPIPTIQLGRPDAPIERVSYILESLINVKDDIKDDKNSKHLLVSISFQKGSVPKPTKNFFEIFNELISGNDVVLLDKTKKFNSVSDWHDLIVVGIAISKPSAQQWLQAVRDVFLHHAANREAYSLTEPRPALLEATIRHRSSVRIKYLTHEEICAIPWKKSVENVDHYISDYYDEQHKEKLQDRRCSQEYDQYIEIDCEDESSSVNHVCIVVDEPVIWKNLIDRNVEQRLEGKWGRGLTKDKWRKDMPDGMFDGSTRFRDSPSVDTPRSFCWETGSPTSELPPNSNIYHTGWDNFTKYEKVEKKYENKMSIVMLTGKQASANAIDKKMYISLSKMYYAKRHGYKFVELFSNQFSHYFPHNLYSSLPSGMAQSDYFRGIMSKILMMLQTMHSNPDSEWVVWTDDDVYINPGWLFMPLDEFLEDVPKNKVMVMNNYRSAFTNILFLRNTEQGRALVYDWLAVAMSGYVQCHGFDQAALGTLIILRAFGGMVAEPFGHTCTWSQEGTTGCNEKNDWSCDFKFEKTMYKAGFRTKRADFFGMKISSFTKGCANEFIPDFHVLYETAKVPRIQCGLCSRITEVNSMGHYDGPRGGGNDVVRLEAIDGWFFGHKAEWLFYQSYLESKNCKKLEGFIENCNLVPIHGSEKTDDASWVRLGRNFISLTDGYAFDLVNGTYCKVTDTAALLAQRQKTYMKEYPDAIAIANEYSTAEWQLRYKQLGGGDGRLPCSDVPGKCKQEGPDGMDTIVHNEQTQQRMFDKADLCQQCRQIEKHDYGYDRRTSTVVDCRTVEEERQDKEQDVNQDI